MGARFKEHLPKSDKESAVLDHVKATGHGFSFEDVSILAREAHYAPRKTREALEIHKYKPQINNGRRLDHPPRHVGSTAGPGPHHHQGTRSSWPEKSGQLLITTNSVVI